MRNTFCLVSFVLAVACTSLDFSPRRKALQESAAWLVRVFAAKADLAARTEATGNAKRRVQVLHGVYREATRELQAIVELLDCSRSDAALHRIEDVERVECQIRTIEERVGNAEKTVQRAEEVLGQVEDALVRLDLLALAPTPTPTPPTPTPTPPTPPTPTPTPNPAPADPAQPTVGAKPVAPAGGQPAAMATASPPAQPAPTPAQRREQLLKVRDALALAEDLPTLRIRLLAATTVLEDVRKDGAKSPVLHARLDQRIVGELANVSARLEAERKKKSDSSRVRRLERAQGKLSSAKAMLTDKEQKPVTDAATLADAEKLLTEAGGLLAEVDSDIVLFSSPWFRAHAGAITVSPYILRPSVASDGSLTSAPERGRFVLDKTTGSTDFYAEMDFLNRRAWLDPDNLVDRDEGFGSTWVPEWMVPDDQEIRMRFVNATTIDSASSAAIGDWAAEASIGWNLFGFGLKTRALCEQQPQVKKRPQGTVNLELNGGLTTDRGALDAHTFAQTGIASVWSFPMQVEDAVWRTATVLFGVYYGVQEFPQLDVDDQQHIVSPRAQFNNLAARSARLDFTIPLGSTFEGVIGGRFFDPWQRDDLPENWSLFVGVTIPIGRILKAATTDG